ncbi:AAHS family 4-hydroxybenzoate transporter-like MFS transporter [Sphingobium sp. JAI105]|uniref:MFS transporter n=1 Tax=Sphingobium sp. JAI105 TaxID=2787715 RepID=UPI0018CB1E2C|nr:MFS transporter [Sphingobium sp. JAI105]MBG6118497.1 AAHS family 4-hydroxybenzoate transporter-like MFS transporter [Sphingobium sp. JAI105]
MESRTASLGEQTIVSGSRIAKVWLLCFLVALTDGFDNQLVSFAAPGISREWDVSKAALGTVLSASIVGMVFGLLVQGALSDRFGRKPVILYSLVAFGACSFLSVLAQSAVQMTALRFVGGVGMGAVLPNAIALTAEFAPERLRSRMVMAMSVGVPTGGLTAGAISTWLLASHGWRTIFLVGGALPLLLAIAVLLFLPESPVFQILREERQKGERSAAAFRNSASQNTASFGRSDGSAQPRSGFAALIGSELRSRTLILWLVCAINLLLLYSLLSWMPLILVASGTPVHLASLSGVLLNLGIIVASFPLGWAADRFGTARILMLCFWAAAGAFVVTGYALSAPLPVLLAGCALLGLTSGGGQLLIIALLTSAYPATVRTTGIGFASIAGRTGAMAGPALCGVLLGAGMTEKWLLVLLAGPAIVGALASRAAHRFEASDGCPQTALR